MIPIEDVITAIEQVLRMKERSVTTLNAETHLHELGLDSLDLAEVFVRLELAVGAELDGSSLRGLSQVGDLTRLHGMHE